MKKEQAQALYAAGKSFQEIAAALDVEARQVARWVRDAAPAPAARDAPAVPAPAVPAASRQANEIRSLHSYMRAGKRSQALSTIEPQQDRITQALYDGLYGRRRRRRTGGSGSGTL